MGEEKSVMAVERGNVAEFVCTSASLRAIRISDDRARSADRAGGRGLREIADVLYFERPVTVDNLFNQLDECPGAAVCVGLSAAGQVIAAVRQGSCVVVVEARFGRGLKDMQGGLAGAALHSALVSGLLLWLAATGRVGPVVALQPASG